jgi:hypothetical protein
MNETATVSVSMMSLFIVVSCGFENSNVVGSVVGFAGACNRTRY